MRYWLISAMSAFKIFEICDQCLDALDRHRVVNRGAHAANSAVSLELNHAVLLCTPQERLVERRVAELERNIHARAVLLAHGIQVERAAVKAIVQELRLGDVP